MMNYFGGNTKALLAVTGKPPLLWLAIAIGSALSATPSLGCDIERARKEIERLVPIGSTVVKLTTTLQLTPITVQRLELNNWTPWQLGPILLNGVEYMGVRETFVRTEPGDLWQNLASMIGCSWGVVFERMTYYLPVERPALISRAPPDSETWRKYDFPSPWIGTATAPVLVRQSPYDDAATLKTLPIGSPLPKDLEGRIHTKPVRVRVAFPRFDFRPGDVFWIVSGSGPSYKIYFEGKILSSQLENGCRTPSYQCWFEVEEIPSESLWALLKWPNGEWGWVENPISVFSGAKSSLDADFDKKLGNAIAPAPFSEESTGLPRELLALLANKPSQLFELKEILGPIEMNSVPNESGTAQSTPRYAMGTGEVGLIKAKLAGRDNFFLVSWSIDFKSGWSRTAKWLGEKESSAPYWRFQNYFFEPLIGDSFRVFWDRLPAEIDSPKRSQEETQKLISWLFRLINKGFDASVVKELNARGMVYDAYLRHFVLRRPTWTLEMSSGSVPNFNFRFHDPLPAPAIAAGLKLSNSGIGWLSPGRQPVEGLIEPGKPAEWSAKRPPYLYYFKAITPELEAPAVWTAPRSAEGALIYSLEIRRNDLEYAEEYFFRVSDNFTPP